MALGDRIAAFTAFRTIPTTVLVLLAYLAIFTSVLLTDQLPGVPKKQRGLDLNQAYADLHHIAARPHPYNSHENDNVRSYILSRLHGVAAGYDHVHIADDLVSNGSWASALYGVYFEGTNVLVKIDGSDPKHEKTGGVLFSAHYDSVSTASGATDDGMGVATLIQLVQYFAENRPKRTAVFNINNGEEDGLNGAHAFLQHPWSKISDTFLNLEGAASGGRPILFRATSTAPVLSFRGKYVPHPHANVLSADAFARGVIRSGTDYSVYTEGAAMEGLDLAFYKGRSKYHTKYDAIPYTDGQERSLWAMMEAARGSGLALLNDDKTHGQGEGGTSVYFDLFGAMLIVFPLDVLLTFNIVFLVIGPVVLILLIAFEAIIEHTRRQTAQNGTAHGSQDNIFSQAWIWFKEFGWVKSLWRWAKFWAALGVAIGLQALLVLGYVKLNPFIVYSEPYLVLLTTFSLAYLSIVLVLRLPISRHGSVPEQQKHTILLQTYILTWFLLLLSTIAVGKADIGGVYFISAWNAVVFIAAVIGCIEGMFGAKGTAGATGEDGEDGTRVVRGVRFEGVPTGDNEGETDRGNRSHSVVVETEPTENTPLIAQHRVAARSVAPPVSGKEEGGAIGWWVLQALLVIPVPVILVAHIGNLLMDAMAQTLADGSSAATVYAATSMLAIFLVLPLAPLSFKIHLWVTYFVGLVFVATTLYTWIVFPFSQEAPLKVFFQQKVFLPDIQSSSPQLTAPGRAVTSLTGAPWYLQRMILPKLPSANGKQVDCVADNAKPGLWTCSWEGGLLPSPGNGKGGIKELAAPRAPKEAWLQAKITRLGPTSARISVKGTNTRSCRLYFDSQNITRYAVQGAEDTMQPKFGIQENGVREVRLWSRTWDRRFTVDVQWEPESHATDGDEGNSGLKGRVACEWVEYESGSIGVGTGGKIPALEEVLTFLPQWAVVSKATDGLVEAWGGFEI